MIAKHLLRPDRLRQIPASFSWVDHRLIRQQHLRDCQPTAWALYLFLVTVADAQGLSYYSEAAISRHLKVEVAMVSAARAQLVRAELVAYRPPLYQVLALPERTNTVTEGNATRSGQPQSVAEILRRALEGGPR
jgi:hypothetical protein